MHTRTCISLSGMLNTLFEVGKENIFSLFAIEALLCGVEEQERHERGRETSLVFFPP